MISIVKMDTTNEGCVKDNIWHLHSLLTDRFFKVIIYST